MDRRRFSIDPAEVWTWNCDECGRSQIKATDIPLATDELTTITQMSQSPDNKARSSHPNASALYGWALAFAVCWGCSDERLRPLASNQALRISNDQLHLGDLWMGAEVEHEIQLENHGSNMLYIEEVRSGCRCAAEINGPKTVPAGGRQIMKLRVSVPVRSDEENYELTIPLDIMASGSSALLGHWEATGRAKKLFTSLPEVVRFDRPILVGKSPPQLTIGLASTVPITTVEASGQSDSADTVEIKVAKPSDRRFRLSMYPHIHAPGVFRIPTKIAATLASGMTVRIVGPTVIGRAVGNVEAVPAQVHLGVLKVGAITKCCIVLRSPTSDPFSVASTTVRGAFAECTTVTAVPTNDSLVRLVISHETTVVGAYSFDVRANVESTDQQDRRTTTDVTIPVSAVGVPQLET